MAQREHGYDRGWCRYSFDTEEFADRAIHGGGTEIGVVNFINRGYREAHISYGVIYPERRQEWPAIGLHVHRDNPTGEDSEEWYIIVEGTGIQRFTNGDSVEFVPGDVIACYPGTGHSIEATGDQPVRFVSVTPKMFRWREPRPFDPWPEKFEPRIRVLTATDAGNALTAECADCGSTWERSEHDFGSNLLADWAVEHECTKPHTPLRLRAGEPMPSSVPAS
jgi:mannose-6-phosphate isomerase-like protein (cupin superfamily)